MHVGNRLKEIIKESGYSLDMIGQHIKVDKSTISRWLKEQELDWSKVHRIMDFIELDTKEYFGNAKNFKDLKSLVRNNDNVELMDKYIKSLENINTLKDELTEAHKLIKELQEELTRAKNES